MKFEKAVKSHNDDERVQTKGNKKGKPGVESSVKAVKNKKKGNTGLTDKSGTGAV